MSHLPSCLESILGMTIESVQGNQVYLKWIGTSGSFGIVARPMEFLSSFMLRPPPLELPWEHQDSFLTKQRNGPSSRDEQGKTGLFLSCGRTLGVPLEWRRACQGTSCVALRMSRTLSRLKRESGISVETAQWKRASSRIEGRISWFFSSCGMLGDSMGNPSHDKCHEETNLTKHKGRTRPQGSPWNFSSIYPHNQSLPALLHYASTYSSNCTAGYS